MKVVIKGESGWSPKIKENLTGNMAGSGVISPVHSVKRTVKSWLVFIMGEGRSTARTLFRINYKRGVICGVVVVTPSGVK